MKKPRKIKDINDELFKLCLEYNKACLTPIKKSKKKKEKKK